MAVGNDLPIPCMRSEPGGCENTESQTSKRNQGIVLSCIRLYARRSDGKCRQGTWEPGMCGGGASVSASYLVSCHLAVGNGAFSILETEQRYLVMVSDNARTTSVLTAPVWDYGSAKVEDWETTGAHRRCDGFRTRWAHVNPRGCAVSCRGQVQGKASNHISSSRAV